MSRIFLALTLALVSACTPEPKLDVAVSIDRKVARPALADFERETGTALAVTRFDPGAPPPKEFDVLWSANPATTIALANAGELAELPDELRRKRSGRFVDSRGRWLAVTADVRVIAYDRKRVDADAVPTRFEDILLPRYAGRMVLARPSSLSAAWHAATLFVARGPTPATAFFKDLAVRGAMFTNDEGEVLAAVAGEGPPIGVVSGAEAFAGRDSGFDIGILIPDQDGAGAGAVLMPTTVAIHRGATESARARQLVEYLTSARGQRRLVPLSSHLALDTKLGSRPGIITVRDVVAAAPSFEDTAAQLSSVRQALADLR